MNNLHKGTLIRTVGGFGDVLLDDGGELRCALRGKLKQKEHRPLVGDRVEVSGVSSGEGVIENILPRGNRMWRPTVSNVDQLLAVISATNPDPGWLLLNSQLVQAERFHIAPLICVNKIDLLEEDNYHSIKENLELFPYRVLYTTAIQGKGIDDLRENLQDKTTVLAGPSGAGKSTLLNAVQPGLQLKTGEVSRKGGRGKHTTRRVELFVLHSGGLVVDTPGFNKLKLMFEIDELKDADLMLKEWFPEFKEFDYMCKFNSCLHDSEPGCAVREAVEDGKLSKMRYRHYLKFLEEIRLEQEKRMK